MRPDQILGQFKGKNVLGTTINGMEDLDKVLTEAAQITSGAMDNYFYAYATPTEKYSARAGVKDHIFTYEERQLVDGVVLPFPLLEKWQTDQVLIGKFDTFVAEDEKELEQLTNIKESEKKLDEKLSQCKSDDEKSALISDMELLWLQRFEVLSQRRKILSDKTTKTVPAYMEGSATLLEIVAHTPSTFGVSHSLMKELDLKDNSIVLVAHPKHLENIKAEERLRQEELYSGINEALSQLSSHSFTGYIHLQNNDNRIHLTYMMGLSPFEETRETFDIALVLSVAEIMGKRVELTKKRPYLIEKNVPVVSHAHPKMNYAELPVSLMRKYGMNIVNQSKPGEKKIFLEGIHIIDLDYAQAFPQFYGLYTKREQENFLPIVPSLKILGEGRNTYFSGLML